MMNQLKIYPKMPLDDLWILSSMFSYDSDYFGFTGDRVKLIAYFSTLFPSFLLATMVTETNRYAEQFLNTNKKLLLFKK